MRTYFFIFSFFFASSIFAMNPDGNENKLISLYSNSLSLLAKRLPQLVKDWCKKIPISFYEENTNKRSNKRTRNDLGEGIIEANQNNQRIQRNQSSENNNICYLLMLHLPTIFRIADFLNPWDRNAFSRTCSILSHSFSIERRRHLRNAFRVIYRAIPESTLPHDFRLTRLHDHAERMRQNLDSNKILNPREIRGISRSQSELVLAVEELNIPGVFPLSNPWTWGNDLNTEVRIGGSGVTAAFEYLGRIFVMSLDSPYLYVFDIRRNEIVSRIRIVGQEDDEEGIQHFGYSSSRIAVSGDHLYVASRLRDRGNIAIIQLSTLTLLDRIPSRFMPQSIAISDGWLIVAGGEIILGVQIPENGLPIPSHENQLVWHNLVFNGRRIYNNHIYQIPETRQLLFSLLNSNNEVVQFLLIDSEEMTEFIMSPGRFNTPQYVINVPANLFFVNIDPNDHDYRCMPAFENFIRAVNDNIYFIVLDRQNQIWLVRNQITHDSSIQSLFRISIERQQAGPRVWGFAIIEGVLFLGIANEISDQISNQIIKIKIEENKLKQETFIVPEKEGLSSGDAMLADLFPSQQYLYFRLIVPQRSRVFRFDTETNLFSALRIDENVDTLDVFIASNGNLYPFYAADDDDNDL